MLNSLLDGPVPFVDKKSSERGRGLSLDRQLDCPFTLQLIERMGLPNTFNKLSCDGAASSEWQLFRSVQNLLVIIMKILLPISFA